jgi:hypothetical protein
LGPEGSVDVGQPLLTPDPGEWLAVRISQILAEGTARVAVLLRLERREIRRDREDVILVQILNDGAH